MEITRQAKFMKYILYAALLLTPGAVFAAEPTKAIQSIYEKDIRKAMTSYGLTKADLAWHATMTYGYDCDEVIERGELRKDFYIIQCSSGKQFKVYPRSRQHPKMRPK